MQLPGTLGGGPRPSLGWNPGLTLAVLGALTLLLTGGCGRQTPEHVIVILVDTMRADALGCYANPAQPTPAMDAFAAEGSRFAYALSTSGWTAPAVASLLTGTWPTIHGAMGKGTAIRPIRPGLATAADVFRAAGYRTLAVANAAFVSPQLDMDRGFEIYDHRHAYNWEIRRADATIDRALELLDEDPGASAFLFIHIFDPHLNYDPPEEYRFRFTGGRRTPAPPLAMETCMELAGFEADTTTPDRAAHLGLGAPAPAEAIDYVRGVYQGEVAFVDTQIGRLVAALRARELYDAATIVITADHGEEFWEHGAFEHGHTLYDELIHIPLLFKPPARAADPDTPPLVPVVESQVRIIDIMPTIFALHDLESPASFAGESFLPAMYGEALADRIVFCESTLYGGEKLVWRDGTHKYIYDMDPATEDPYEFYNWREDPGELQNLFRQQVQQAHAFHERLAEFYQGLKTQADALPPTEVRDMSPEQFESLKSLGYIR